MALRFVIGTIENFTTAGIDVSNERKSLDGLQSLKHIELLSDEQFDTIRFDVNFEFKSDAAITELMNTPEWKTNE